jgi:hypothetical protein
VINRQTISIFNVRAVMQPLVGFRRISIMTF